MSVSRSRRSAGNRSSAREVNVSGKLVRKGLLCSTALIAASLAASGAMAQTYNPTGGGAIVIAGGGVTTDNTGASGGFGNVGGTSFTSTDVNITNTTGAPTTSAIDFTRSTFSGVGDGGQFVGTNTLVAASGGSAFNFVSTGGNNTGIGFNGTLNATGRNGIAISTSGAWFHGGAATFNLTAQTAGQGSGLLANAASCICDSSFTGAFNATNFQYGANLTAPGGINFATGTGGTISGVATGVSANSSGGAITLAIGSSISASGMGISAISSGVGSVSVTSNAAIVSGGTGIHASTSATTGNALNLNADVSGVGFGVRADGQGYTISVGAGATLTGSGTNSRALFVGSSGGVVVNNGTIRNTSADAGSAIQLTDAAALTNFGSITSVGDTLGVVSSTGLTLSNSGTIAGARGGIWAGGVGVGQAASITNLAGGSITGGVDGTGPAILLRNGGPGLNTLDLRQGSITGGIDSSPVGATTVLLAGTMTGDYSGAGASSTVSFTLASTGSMTGAAFGAANDSFTWQGGSFGSTINGGSGTNSFFSALGMGSGTLNLSNITNFQTLTHQSGTATLTGTSAAPFTTILAGTGVPSGTLIFNGTSGLTSAITVNGAVVRAATAGGFGTGTITMLDPTIEYGATGTYANNILLSVASPASADPSTFRADAGVTATLSGSLTRGGGDTAQPVVIGGLGTIVLTNSANSWTGSTTVNAGATLQGTAATISGSSIITNGVLQYTATGTVNQAISGTGALTASGGMLTLTGSNSWSGLTTVNSGVTLSGTTGSIAGGSIVNNGTLNYVNTTAGTASQNISGSGQINVSGLGAGQALIFAGTLTNANGIDILDGSAIVIAGDMTTANGPAIASNAAGISVTNLGAMSANAGSPLGTINLGLGGTIINGSASNSTASITGGYAAIYNTGGALIVTNYGALDATAGYGIVAQGGNGASPTSLTLVNSGRITGGDVAVVANDTTTSNSITNTSTGLIRGVNQGAALRGTSTVNNSGDMVGGVNGLWLIGTSTTNLITNSGRIASGTIAGNVQGGAITVSGGSAIELAGGTVNNLAGGQILGNTAGINSSAGNLSVTNGGQISGVSGIRASGGAATIVNAGTITGSGTTVSTGGIVTAAGGSITNQAGGQITGAIGVMSAGGTLALTNSGTITGANPGLAGVNAVGSGSVITNHGTIQGGAQAVLLNNGGTVHNLGASSVLGTTNTAALTDASGIYSNGALTLTNEGAISTASTGASHGVQVLGVAAITNTGSITAANGSGVFFNGGGSSLVNAGTITGGASATIGYGVQNAAASGLSTITNQAGGVIGGGAGSILLSGAGNTDINMLAGSTTNGQILSTNNGTHNVVVAGVLNGAYNAATGSGVDNITLASTGSMTSAALGGGNDTFLFQGGTFSGLIDGGSGTDVFNATLGLGGAASVNVANITLFETQNVNSGTLTLTGARAGGAGWIVATGAAAIVSGQLTGNTTAFTLNDGASLQLTSTGVLSRSAETVRLTGAGALTNSGVISSTSGNTVRADAGGSITNQAGGQINAVGNNVAGISAQGGATTVVNGGSITGVGTAVSGIWQTGGSLNLTNASGGVISSAESQGIRVTSLLETVIVNSGTITAAGGGYGFLTNGGDATITNNTGGLIEATGTGGAILGNGTGTLNVTNSGTIRSSINSSQGVLGIFGQGGSFTNLSGGQLTALGTGPALALGSVAATTVVLEAGSTVTGTINSTSSGSRTVVIAGTLNGAYNASSGTGVDTLTLASTGSMTSAALGAGNDTFLYQGGTFSGLVDGGSHTGAGDLFRSALGAGSASISLNNLSNFETYSQESGSLTLTGARSGGVGWQLLGGTLTLNGSLTNTGVDAAGVQTAGITVLGANSTVNIGAGAVLWAQTQNGVQVGFVENFTLNNSGAIGGGTGFAGVRLNRSATINNFAGGVITSSGVAGATGISNSGAGVVVNNSSGATITGNAAGIDNVFGVEATAPGLTVFNSGSITTFGANTAAIRSDSGALVLNNNAGGTISGFAGVSVTGGAATIYNSGTISGGVSFGGPGLVSIANYAGGVIESNGAGGDAIRLYGSNAADLFFQNGSTVTGDIDASAHTGFIQTYLQGAFNGAYAGGAGDDNFNLYTSATGVFSLDGGAGTSDAVNFESTGDSTRGGSMTNFEVARFNGAGTVTLTGTNTGFQNVFINAGTVSVSSAANMGGATGVVGLVGGVLQTTASFDSNRTYYTTSFSGQPGRINVGAGTTFGIAGGLQGDGDLMLGGAGTLNLLTTNSGFSGDIFVDGSALRAGAAGAFGTGTIHLINPTLIYGASGAYANDILLEVQGPASADPSTLNAEAGVTAVLTGSITQGAGMGVDPVQPLVIGGAGVVVLTNTANSWAGTTTINAGATLQGATDTISGSNTIANGVLALGQPLSGTFSQNVSGAGTVQVFGLNAGETLTLSGALTNANGVVVTDASSLTVTGSIASSVQGVQLNAGGSVTNSGVIHGGLDPFEHGVFAVAAGSTVHNLSGGVIDGWRGVAFNAAGAVTNAGAIRGLGAEGVSFFGGAGSVTNLAGGIVSGLNHGVYSASGSSLTVVNSGQIRGGLGDQQRGVYTFAANSSVTNNAGGLIDGWRGIELGAGATGGVVNNAGAINGAAQGVLSLAAGASVGNTGTISASAGQGVYLDAGGSLTNSGVITGGNHAFIGGGGVSTVANLAGGVMTGTTFNAVYTGGAGSVITNAGVMNGGNAGVYTDGADTSLTNSGVIRVTGTTAPTVISGVYMSGAGSSVTNSGVIESALTDGRGVFLSGGAGSVTNQSGGVISGNGAGAAIILTGAGYTLDLQTGSSVNGLIDASTSTGANALTLAGTLNGGYLGGAGADDVTLVGGASLTGILVGGDGVDSLVLAGSGDGTLNASLTGGFESRTLNGTGAWTLSGTDGDVSDWTLNAGELRLTGGQAINNLAGIIVNAGATLSVIDSEAIGALTGTGAVVISNAQALVVGADDGSSTFGGVISGLGGLQHVGAGTLTLTGANTYTGLTLVQGGTLRLGASGVIADVSDLTVLTGATLDLQGFDETVRTLLLNGTLAGTGTLTAGQYQLDGATVNANLGAGALFNLGGVSTLSGTAGAASVVVQAGTLTLGASDRLADTA
ncbi:MAG: autotransporter-associated beta strand repeat-containing protein, partial [Alphaproteobacteria bacterium]|nr:autotransporter-associated beta strand repeat-containing protein [Alphaproteobacteria bacterium]